MNNQSKKSVEEILRKVCNESYCINTDFKKGPTCCAQFKNGKCIIGRLNVVEAEQKLHQLIAKELLGKVEKILESYFTDNDILDYFKQKLKALKER